MQNSAPSVKRLMAAFRCTKEEAELARKIIRREVHPLEIDENLFPNTRAWVRSCFNKPKRCEIEMEALNELLDCHGCEAVFEEGEMWPWLEYLNTGDMYNQTLCRRDGFISLSSPAGIIERDKRGALHG